MSARRFLLEDTDLREDPWTPIGEGVQFTDGRVVVCWPTKDIELYKDLTECLASNHRVRLVWRDPSAFRGPNP